METNLQAFVPAHRRELRTPAPLMVSLALLVLCSTSAAWGKSRSEHSKHGHRHHSAHRKPRPLRASESVPAMLRTLSPEVQSTVAAYLRGDKQIGSGPEAPAQLMHQLGLDKLNDLGAPEPVSAQPVSDTATPVLHQIHHSEE